MMIVLSIIEIARGHEPQWQDLWASTRGLFERQDGFRGTRLLGDVDHPRRYVVLSEWERRADHDTAMRTLGIPWLDDALDFLAKPTTLIYLQESESSQPEPNDAGRNEGTALSMEQRTDDESSDDSVTDASMASFPASDPPSWILMEL